MHHVSEVIALQALDATYIYYAYLNSRTYIRGNHVTAKINTQRNILLLQYIRSQWEISNKLNHFRFARIAVHFLQCRQLQAEDNEIVNIELTR